MVLFDVSQLMNESSGSTRAFDLGEAFLSLDAANLHRVCGTIQMLRTDKGIWVSAKLDTEAPSACSRCLIDFSDPIHVDIEEEFFPSIELLSGSSVEDAEGNFYMREDHTLDLTAAAVQYFALSVPMKPICREDCAGICPNCGTDLNITPCHCVTDIRDARWNALLDMTTSGSPPVKGVD